MYYHDEFRNDEEEWPTGRGPADGPVGGWLEMLRGLPGPWGWDDLAAEVGQESQARVVVAGLADAGKSLLFNRLRGWVVSWPASNQTSDVLTDDWPAGDGIGTWMPAIRLEPFGSFILARLPAEPDGSPIVGEELLLALGDPSLVVYLLDAAAGVRPADYRWVATLRAGGRPLVVALNKCDLAEGCAVTAAEAEQRLGMPVIPISALTGQNVEERLLPALLDAAPKVAVPLGREILCLRRVAARRMIRQVALFAGMMGAQPIPLLDLPFQAMLQVGLVMRVGAVYGRAPSGGISREVVSTVAGSLGFRYLALALIKVVPFLGWAVSGVASAAMTLLLGEAAIHYYEAGGTIPLRQFLARGRDRLGQERARTGGWLRRHVKGVQRGRKKQATPGDSESSTVDSQQPTTND